MPGRPRAKIAVSTARELQQLLVDDCKNPRTKPAVRAVCARTWDILEERIRVLRMHPAPKSIDPRELTAQRRATKLAKRGIATLTQAKEFATFEGNADPPPAVSPVPPAEDTTKLG